MSTEELIKLTEMLEVETQTKDKYQDYSNKSENLQLKQTCQKVESKHKTHINKLLSLLGG